MRCRRAARRRREAWQEATAGSKADGARTRVGNAEHLGGKLPAHLPAARHQQARRGGGGGWAAEPQRASMRECTVSPQQPAGPAAEARQPALCAG